jgi:vacuolar-type H+-ATPase subunit I/STV1
MEDIMFATFLYAAIICFVCCLRYQPSCTTTVVTNTADLQASTPQSSDMNQALIHEPEQNLEAANALIATETNSQLPVTEHILDVSEDSQLTSLSTGQSSLDTVLDPSKLTLRQCRAVIREINKGLPKLDRIRQKINGKDAPADWLRSQIARYLETHQDKAMVMEEILKAG